MPIPTVVVSRSARRRLAPVALAPAMAALAACSDPSLDVSITYLQPNLAGHIDTVNVSVLAAGAAGELAGLTDAGGQPRPADCDDVALGRIPPAALDGARRATTAPLESPSLTGVPRLGDKLVFVEARSRAGLRIGAGCTALGDVERDTSVAVDVAIAPRVHEFASLVASSQVTLIATEPWLDGAPLAGYQVVVELHGPGGMLSSSASVTDAEGLATAPIDSGSVPGPTQTVVRVRWAPDLVRVSRFSPWSRRAVRTPSTNRLSPRWVTGRVTYPPIDSWVAAAVHSRFPDDTTQLELIEVDGAGQLVLTTVPADPARALVLWNQALFTVLSDGWHRVTPAGISSGVQADPGGVATEMHVIGRCGPNAGALGMLIRRGTSQSYDPYVAPGMRAAAGSVLANLAIAVGTDDVVGQLCVTDDTNTTQKVVLVRGGNLEAITPDGTHYGLPTFTGVTEFVRNGRYVAAGVAFTLTGPRVTSYRLGTYVVDGQPTPGLVTNDAVDVALSTTPTSVLVHDLDGDGAFDVLAAIPTGAGTHIQAVMGQLVAGEPLTAVTGLLPDTRGVAISTRMVLEQIDGAPDNCFDAVVLTDAGVDVYAPQIADATGTLRCPEVPAGL